MRILTVPESCTRKEFVLCAKNMLKALTPFGKALIVLDEDEVEYGDSDRDGAYCYSFFSDRWPAEQITHGQIADLIAIEDPSHFSKESLMELLVAFEGKKKTILLVQERKRKEDK